MEEYKEFRDSMEVLEKFIEGCETKDIDGEIHITIDDNNVDEFKGIMENLITIASSDDNYVDEILEYLNEIDKKILDRDMIAKFIPLFAAINCFATATRKFTKEQIAGLVADQEVTLFEPTSSPNVDDWVFELHDLDQSAPPLEARLGKVLNIVNNEDGTVVHKVKAPVANEVIEWEDATFVVIPNMEATMKKYQEKYVKTF